MISFKSTLFHDIHWPGKANYVKQMEWSSSPLPHNGYDICDVIALIKS